MITEVRVEGIKEVRRDLKRLDADSGKAIQQANRTAAQTVVDAALPNVPVRSGRLRGSVRAMASQTSGRAAAGKATVPYAAAIHWGEGAGNVNHSSGGSVKRKNRNIRGRPFLWEAADRVLNRVVEAYDREITDLIDRTVRTG